MAKLYFRYAAMNAGKSTELLKDAHNYEERGLGVRLFTAKIDTRAGEGEIYSRLGLRRMGESFDETTDFDALLAQDSGASPNPTLAGASSAKPTDCVFIDEAQFLTPAQVEQLHRHAHLHDLPIICYGLRSDFLGQAFPGAAALLTLADSLDELKTICACKKKASMNARLDGAGRRVRSGAQVHIGGNESYVAMCPACFYSTSKS
jgi:thymidine kinase